MPIISSPSRHEITQFYVALGEPGSLHSSGPGTRSLVTIDHGTIATVDPNAGEKRLIVAVAQGVDGVKRVDDQLEVAPD